MHYTLRFYEFHQFVRWQTVWSDAVDTRHAVVDACSHSLLNVCRDVDGEPVNLDDNICDQILSAAEALQYVELSEGAMPAGTSSYDVDLDTSTPDHMTSSSDPDVVQVGDLQWLETVYFHCYLCDQIMQA